MLTCKEDSGKIRHHQEGSERNEARRETRQTWRKGTEKMINLNNPTNSAEWIIEQNTGDSPRECEYECGGPCTCSENWEIVGSYAAESQAWEQARFLHRNGCDVRVSKI